VGGLLGRKKKGQPLGRPVMNGMKLLNMMFISIFPGNFSRALSLHCLSRSFFRICCMYSDLTFRLLLLRESARRFSAIPYWLSNDQSPSVTLLRLPRRFQVPHRGDSASIGFSRLSGECRKCFGGEFVPRPSFLAVSHAIAGETWFVRRLVKAREYVKL